MKNVNNFQIAKAQNLLRICLISCQYQPGAAYKSVVYKEKSVYSKQSWISDIEYGQSGNSNS